MAAEAGTAYVAVRGDFSEFESDAQAAGSGIADSFGQVGSQAGDSMVGGVTSKFGAIGDTMAGVLGANAVMKAGDSLVGFFSGAVDKAEAAEQANIRFETTLRNVAHANEEQVTSATAFIKQLGSDTATSGTQLKEAFSTLVRGTGDATKAQDGLKLATDISAATGRDLSSVSMALSRAYMGNTGALGRMGVATKDASGHALSLDQVMQNLHTTFDGTAATMAGTAGGQMKSAELQFGAMQKQVGQALMPAMMSLANILTTYVMPALMPLITAFGTIMQWLGPLVPAIMAVVVAFKAWAVIQAILNSELMANPIFLVAVAIAALVAGVIWAYQNVGWFRAAVDALGATFKATFDVILAVVQGVWDWIVNNWPLLLAVLTGPFGAAIYLVVSNWGAIKDALAAAWNWVSDNWPLLLAILTGPFGLAIKYVIDNFDQIRAAVQRVIDGAKAILGGLLDAVNAIPDTIKGAFANAGRWLYDAGRAIIQGLIDGIKSMASSVGGVVGDIAKGAVNGVKSLLHIGSPSRVFFDIGADTMAGFVQGVQQSAPEVHGALSSSMLGGATAPGIAPTGGAVTNTLVVNGSVYGVEDLHAFMDQRDRQLALTLAGGRR